MVGAGGDAGVVGPRKNTAPSDLSGEAMGLRTASVSNKADSPGRSGGPTLGDIGFSKAVVGGGGDAGGGSTTTKSDGGGGVVGRDGGGSSSGNNSKDGGFFGGFSRALTSSRGQGQAEEREGEEEIGREEDVQVARFVLMLLQYNFPYISHVRGDMSACLEELSAQVRERERERTAEEGAWRGGAVWGGDLT